MILGIFLVSYIKNVPSYDLFVKGAKEGILYFYSLFPNLLGMFFAVSLLRESGIYNIITDIFTHFISFIPADLIPMMLTRPISGTASLAILKDILVNHSPDSFVGFTASLIQSATDTTVYVISLYFGSIQIKKIRNSLKISLIADVVGMSLSLLFSFLYFYHF